MKHVLALATSIALLASQAAALSCARPDVASSFQNAADSEKSYSVLLGRFNFTEIRSGRGAAPQPHSVSASFSGQALGAAGFAPTSVSSVTLDFACVASWCGSLRPGQPVMAFVEHGQNGYRLTVSACPYWVFENPTSEDISRVEDCMAGRGCEAEPDRHRR